MRKVSVLPRGPPCLRVPFERVSDATETLMARPRCRHRVPGPSFDVSDEELDYLTHGFDRSARRFVVEDAFQELRGDFGPLPVALGQPGIIPPKSPTGCL